MSDHLDIHGGAGGLAAALADLRRHAELLAAAADDLTGMGRQVTALGAAADLAQAALLCPDLVAVAERDLALAGLGPVAGLCVVGAELDALALAVRWCAEAYERVDAGVAASLTAGTHVAGYTVGLAAPAVGAALVTAVLANPLLLATLSAYAASGTAGEDLDAVLLKHPELQDILLRLAPWMVQGAATSVASLGGIVGTAGLAALTGGQWPTGRFENAVAGLSQAGQHTGRLTDSGRFHVAATPSAVSAPVPLDPALPLSGLLVQQKWLDSWVPGGSAAEREQIADQAGELSVVTVTAPEGSTAYVVHIPGTEMWDSQRGDNPVDLTTNVALMAEHQAQLSDLVAATIRTQVPAGAPVLLVGHSQGGLTAASVASDRRLVAAFDIRGVVTVGSPVAHFPIDPSVSVLSLEHTQDAVALLDGAANPDRATWVTVRRDLSEPGLAICPGGSTLASSHDLVTYEASALEVDLSDDPALVAWREANAVFFRGVAQSAQYAIVSDDSSVP